MIYELKRRHFNFYQNQSWFNVALLLHILLMPLVLCRCTVWRLGVFASVLIASLIAIAIPCSCETLLERDLQRIDKR